MKIAVTGKGGAGKTTITALLAWTLHKRGYKCVIIDVDPNSCVLSCMGYTGTEKVKPLVEMKELIEERTGVKPGTIGGMFRMNPYVDDICDKFGIDIHGIKVLVAGTVKKGGTGCYCPENAFVRALVSKLLLSSETALLLDMEAGVEHLSRGTVQAVDSLIVVVEPAKSSIETAFRIRDMAKDIGLTRIFVVGNKIKNEEEQSYIVSHLRDMKIAGFIPYDEAVRRAETKNQPPWEISSAVDSAISALVDFIKEAQ
jgi:CO dehydrogenase maturation factor